MAYEQIVKQIQDILKVFIVPAILDHDETARGKQKGIYLFLSKQIMTEECHKTSFFPGKRVSGVFHEPISLVKQLDHFYEHFKIFGLDEIFIDQIFKQIFYYICAISLNNLMLRHELCMWKTGMKIRYNITCLEDWARKMKMVFSIVLLK